MPLPETSRPTLMPAAVYYLDQRAGRNSIRCHPIGRPRSQRYDHRDRSCRRAVTFGSEPGEEQQSQQHPGKVCRRQGPTRTSRAALTNSVRNSQVESPAGTALLPV